MSKKPALYRVDCADMDGDQLLVNLSTRDSIMFTILGSDGTDNSVKLDIHNLPFLIEELQSKLKVIKAKSRIKS